MPTYLYECSAVVVARIHAKTRTEANKLAKEHWRKLSSSIHETQFGTPPVTHSISLGELPFEFTDEVDNPDDPMFRQLLIKYQCPKCGRKWADVWDSAVDGECPGCGMKNISPLNWEEIEQ